MIVLTIYYFSTSNPLDFSKHWGRLAYVNLRKEQRSRADLRRQPAMPVGYVTAPRRSTSA
jgi:hypothetical protein